MPRFANGREAKEFLVSLIVAEAQCEGVPLSEVERKMLYFSETAWTLPDMMDVNEQFDREYGQAAYEKKIANLIRKAAKRARKENPSEYESMLEAVRKLRKEDHYILVMMDQAGIPAGRVSWSWKVYAPVVLIVCLACASSLIMAHYGVFAPRPDGRFGSYVVNPKLDNIIGYAYLGFLALVICGVIVARFDPQRRAYKFLERFTETMMGLIRPGRGS